MFGKRGQQLSIAILGIVIFLGLIGIFYQIDKSVKELRTARQAIDDTRFADHMQQCLEQSIRESAAEIGLQGGYFALPERKAQFDEQGIPIYLSLATGTYQIPSAVMVGEAMAKRVEERLPGCVDLFAAPYDIERSQPSVQITFNPDTVNAEVEYPITLRAGKHAKTLSAWGAVVPSAFPGLLTAAQAYTTAQQEKSFIRLQQLVDAAVQHHATVTLTDIGNGIVAYQFMAERVTLQFAIEYSWERLDSSFGSIVNLLPEQINALGSPVTVTAGTFPYGDLGDVLTVEKKQGNTPPIIPTYAPQRVVVGRTLLLPLNVEDADGDRLTYEVLTPLPGLEIKPNGVLQWGPTNYQEVTIKFRVSDGIDSREGELHLIADYRPRVDFEKLSYP